MLAESIEPYLNSPFINIIGISYHDAANFVIIRHYKNINVCAIKFSY